jgi:Trp operon repressor
LDADYPLKWVIFACRLTGKAREILRTLLTREEREAAVAREQGGMQVLLEEMLLTEH